MFGWGRKLKQTKIGLKLEAAKDRLEKLADDHDFRHVFNAVKKEVEKQIDILEGHIAISGVQKGQKLLDWLRNNHPDTIPHLGKFLEWASAWVDLKKAAGLFK